MAQCLWHAPASARRRAAACASAGDHGAQRQQDFCRWVGGAHKQSFHISIIVSARGPLTLVLAPVRPAHPSFLLSPISALADPGGTAPPPMLPPPPPCPLTCSAVGAATVLGGHSGRLQRHGARFSAVYTGMWHAVYGAHSCHGAVCASHGGAGDAAVACTCGAAAADVVYRTAKQGASQGGRMQARGLPALCACIFTQPWRLLPCSWRRCCCLIMPGGAIWGGVPTTRPHGISC